MDEMLRVLHVDDDEDFTALVADVLERSDSEFDVITARDADAALGTVERLGELLDCIVSEYALPDRDGLELLDAVRARTTGGPTPFILFTDSGDESVASEAISAGVTDYLPKRPVAKQCECLADHIQNAVGQHRIEREFARQQELFVKAQDLAQVGAWEWDPQVGAGHYSEQVYDIYGLDSGSPAPRPDDPELYHPDDRTAVRTAFERALERNESYDIEVRAVVDGETKWVRTRGEPTFEGGTCVRIRGTVQDITERKERERHLDRYRTVVETAGDPMYALDSDGRIEMVNEAFVEFSGYDREDVVGEHVSKFISVAAVEEGREIIASLLEDGDRRYGQLTFEASGPDGDCRTYRDTISILEADGAFRGSVGVVKDVTEQVARATQLRALHRATRRLMTADTPAAVAEVVVETARESLEMPHNCVWLYDEADDCLEPVAVTEAGADLVGGVPTFERGEGLAWEVFQSGEPEVFDELHEQPGRYNPDTPLRSEILVPLGEYGLLAAGSTEPGEFTGRMVSMARILAANAETAIRRIEG